MWFDLLSTLMEHHDPPDGWGTQASYSIPLKRKGKMHFLALTVRHCFTALFVEPPIKSKVKIIHPKFW